MAVPLIDRDMVLHVAKLASLTLPDSEVDRLASDLGHIVAYVQQLENLDTQDVPPTYGVAVGGAPGRPDEVVQGLTPDEALAQAPEVEGDGFAVPAFLE